MLICIAIQIGLDAFSWDAVTRIVNKNIVRLFEELVATIHYTNGRPEDDYCLTGHREIEPLCPYDEMRMCRG